MSDQGRQLDLTPEALSTIAAMRRRVAAVADMYGQNSPEHAEVADSLANALVQMIQLGGRIMRDGREDELCLLGVSFITYGVVRFPAATARSAIPARVLVAAFMRRRWVSLRMTFEALAVVSNMRYRVNQVAEEYGEVSPEHLAMLRSLVFGLHHVMRHGGTVQPDNEDREQLSLIGGTWIVWRLVFVQADGGRLLGQWVFYR